LYDIVKVSAKINKLIGIYGPSFIKRSRIRSSNPLNAFLLAPQVRLLPTIVRVYKLYLLARLLTYLLTYLDGSDIILTWTSDLRTLFHRKLLCKYADDTNLIVPRRNYSDIGLHDEFSHIIL